MTTEEAKRVLRDQTATEAQKQEARAYLHTVAKFGYSLINAIEDTAKAAA